MWEEKKIQIREKYQHFFKRRATRRNLKKSRKSAAWRSKTLEVHKLVIDCEQNILYILETVG